MSDVLALDGADEPYVRNVVATICGVPCPEDALTFDLSSVRIFPIRAAQQQPNQRVTLTARLGNARIPLQVDVGFGDIVVPGPEEVRYPTLLDGMTAPSVRAYPLASSVAEKFEAIVQLGQQNSRMKDFHDVWALSETFGFDGSVLREAIRACFAHPADGLDHTDAVSPHFDFLLERSSDSSLDRLSKFDRSPYPTAGRTRGNWRAYLQLPGADPRECPRRRSVRRRIGRQAALGESNRHASDDGTIYDPALRLCNSR